MNRRLACAILAASIAGPWLSQSAMAQASAAANLAPAAQAAGSPGSGTSAGQPHARPASAPAPAAPASAPTLAAGTPISLRIDQTVKSNGTAEGDPVEFTVVQPVYSTDPSHDLFIERGAPAMGHVIVSSKRGFVGRRGDLQFQIDYVMDVAGQRVYLVDQCIGGDGSDHGAESVAVAIAISAAGLLIQGGDKKYNAGSLFTAYVDQDATLPPPALAAPDRAASAQPGAPAGGEPEAETAPARAGPSR